MTRRQGWIGGLVLSLLYLVVTAKFAFDQNAFGPELTGLLRAIAWGWGIVAGALAFIGIRLEASKSAVIGMVNSLPGRLTIVIVSLVGGTIFLIAALRPTPPQPETWTCEIRRAHTGTRADCGGTPFGAMRSFALQLRRATDPTELATVQAEVTDARAVVIVDSNERACKSQGRNWPLPGQSQLELTTACGRDRTYLVNVRVCSPMPPRPGTPQAAELAASVKLAIAEGHHAQTLHCTGEGPESSGSGSGSGSDAGQDVCPRWAAPAPEGRHWLYVQARGGAHGAPLTVKANQLVVEVRSEGQTRGERAEDDDPCTVATYAPATPRVWIDAYAIGFTATGPGQGFRPTSCVEDAPCTIDLQTTLPASAYVASSGQIRVRSAHEIHGDDALRSYAAAMAEDALIRAKRSGRSLADELEASAKVARLPAKDLAFRYTEVKLGRTTCDATCVDAREIDDTMRTYLRSLRRPGHPNPFELRRPLRPER